jgi:hypothetical protein
LENVKLTNKYLKCWFLVEGSFLNIILSEPSKIKNTFRVALFNIFYSENEITSIDGLGSCLNKFTDLKYLEIDIE